MIGQCKKLSKRSFGLKIHWFQKDLFSWEIYVFSIFRCVSISSFCCLSHSLTQSVTEIIQITYIYLFSLCKLDLVDPSPANLTQQTWPSKPDPANLTLQTWPSKPNPANLTWQTWPPTNMTKQTWPSIPDPANLTLVFVRFAFSCV